MNTAFDITNILNLGRRGSSTVTARLASMSQGSPPLWLTRKNNDFYLNGAKLTFRNLRVGFFSNIAYLNSRNLSILGILNIFLYANFHSSLYL